MRLSFMIVMALLGLAERAAYALCVPGTVEVCFANGKQGTRTCRANGFFGPCEVPDDPPPPSGYGRPKYKVLTVVYAPPGTQGGGSTSAVSYGNGSTWGSTTTCENGFKQEYTTTVSATGGFLGELTGSLIFGYGRSSTDSKATEIKKSSLTTISLGGPSVDGIDHDCDLIWLWLNPKLRVSLPTATAIEWKLDSSEPMDIQYVYVGHLKDPSQMPPGVAQRLAYYGITTADYADILEADPYAYGPVPVSSRYVSLNTTFPYEPPYAPGDPVPTLNFTATYSSTDTSGSEVVNEYTSGVTWEGGLDFISLVQAKLKVESKWTWTDTKSLFDSDRHRGVCLGDDWRTGLRVHRPDRHGRLLRPSLQVVPVRPDRGRAADRDRMGVQPIEPPGGRQAGPARRQRRHLPHVRKRRRRVPLLRRAERSPHGAARRGREIADGRHRRRDRRRAALIRQGARGRLSLPASRRGGRRPLLV